MRADDFCHLAADLLDEHGPTVVQLALRASADFACDGVNDRALFWYALSLFLDDIVSCRLDADRPLVLH